MQGPPDKLEREESPPWQTVTKVSARCTWYQPSSGHDSVLPDTEGMATLLKGKAIKVETADNNLKEKLFMERFC